MIIKTNIYKKTLFFVFIIFASPSRAETVFPQALWESKPLPGTIVTAASGDVNGDGLEDVVFATPNTVFLSTPGLNQNQEIVFKSHHVEKFHRVHIGHFGYGEGQKILLNGFVQDQAFSELWHFDQGKWRLLQRFSAIVMPLFWKGDTVLFEQKLRGRGGWAKEIVMLSWNGKKMIRTQEEISLNRGFGRAEVNLFSVVGMNDKLAILQNSGHIDVIDENGKVLWRSGVKYGGAVDALVYQNKDPLGIQKGVALHFMPRMMFDNLNNRIYVIKNSGVVSQTAQYFALVWTSGGLQESFASRRFDGSIADLNLSTVSPPVIPNAPSGVLLLSLWAGKSFLTNMITTPTSILTTVTTPSF